MYTYNQIIEGINNPDLIKLELETKVKQYLPHDVGVQGSYNTGNIGDKALGKIFKTRLETDGYSVRLFPDTVSKSNSNYQILGGGGVLHDWYGADHLRKRLNYVSDGGFIIGVGVPGFRSKEAKQLASRKIPNTSLITVRDRQSKKRINEVCNADVTVTADPAFLYEDPGATSKYKTGVNFRPWFKYSTDEFPWSELDEETLCWHFDFSECIDRERAFKSYIKNAQQICEAVSDPVFIPFHKMDQQFAENHLDVTILEYTPSVKETLYRISSVEKMVASRYHSLVFAAITKTPVYALTYAPKVRELSNRLEIPHSDPNNVSGFSFGHPRNIENIKKDAEKNFEMLYSNIGV